MTHNRLRGVAVLALSLVLVGCSSSSETPTDTNTPTTTNTPAAAGAIPNPCSLLTVADIDSATGISYQPGVFDDQQSDDSHSICNFQPVDGVLPFVQVLVSPGESQIAAQRGTADDFLGGSVDVTVAGATNAYAVAGGSIVGMTVNGFFVQVSYMTSDMGEVTATTVTLAEKVASAL